GALVVEGVGVVGMDLDGQVGRGVEQLGEQRHARAVAAERHAPHQGLAQGVNHVAQGAAAVRSADHAVVVAGQPALADRLAGGTVYAGSLYTGSRYTGSPYVGSPYVGSLHVGILYVGVSCVGPRDPGTEAVPAPYATSEPRREQQWRDHGVRVGHLEDLPAAELGYAGRPISCGCQPAWHGRRRIPCRCPRLSCRDLTPEPCPARRMVRRRWSTP